MTTQELINYYADLLILQYLGKPKAYATIQTLVTPVVMDQLPTQVQAAFNLLGDSIASGVQLSILGKYAGVTRTGYGFNGDPITLNDVDFLTLIRFAIIKNSSGSSLADIQRLINQYFTPGEILVFDYQNMQMSYLISSAIGSQNLVQLLVTEGLLPKPMAVALASVIYAPIIDAFFGFRTYRLPAHNASPFNDYADYQLDWPWLSYQDTVEQSTIEVISTEDGDNLVTEDGDAIITE